MRFFYIIALLLLSACSEETPSPEPLNSDHERLIGAWELIEREVFENSLLTITESPDELHTFGYDTYIDGDGKEWSYQPEGIDNVLNDTLRTGEDLTLVLRELESFSNMQLFKHYPDGVFHWEYYRKAVD